MNGLKNRLIWLLSPCLIACADGVHAADSVTIPGYVPATGVEHAYRSQKMTETDMSLWFNKPAVVTRGDFRQRMTVLSRDMEGMRVRWSLSADLPQEADGKADSYALNTLFRNSLSAYGVRQLEYVADLNGTPTQVIGIDAILANIESAAANGPGGLATIDRSSASGMIQSLKTNPNLLVHRLVPEAALLSTVQEQEAATFDVGQEYAGGVPVSFTFSWKLDSADLARQTATFSATKTYDSVAFQQSQKTAIEGLIASFGERAKQLSAEQLAAARTARKSVSMIFVKSLHDGSTLEAAETITVDSGGVRTTAMSHVWREDQPATLSRPYAWGSGKF